MPISNDIFEIITRASAKYISPLSGKYKSEVKRQHNKVKKTSKDFLYPVLSANAPKIGEISATVIAVIEIAFAHKKVPSCSLDAI